MFARVSAPEPEVEESPEDLAASAPADQQPQLKGKRGRPRKIEAPRPPGDAPPIAGPPQPKRKRGRPRKVSLPPADAPGKGECETLCAAAASAASAGLLVGSALPSLGLPKVPSLLMPSRLSESAACSMGCAGALSTPAADYQILDCVALLCGNGVLCWQYCNIEQPV